MSAKEHLIAAMISLAAFVICCYGFVCPANTAEPVKMYSSENISSAVSTSLVKTPEGLYRIFIYSSYQQGGITAVKIK